MAVIDAQTRLRPSRGLSQPHGGLLEQRPKINIENALSVLGGINYDRVVPLNVIEKTKPKTIVPKVVSFDILVCQPAPHGIQ